MILYILGLFFICGAVNGQETSLKSYVIPLDKPITDYNRELYSSVINVTGLSTTQFNFININSNVSFVIFQAHSYLYNITMYNNTKQSGSWVMGTNVGLYSTVDPIDTFFIINPNEQDLKLFIAVHGYEDSDPIPGGCNMENRVSTAPYLEVQMSRNKDYFTVDGGAPKPPRVLPSSNDCSNADIVTLDFYRIYLPERDFSVDTYFGGIQAMMNYESIIEKGELIRTTTVTRVRRTLSAYPGTGSVLVAVASIKITNDTSNYTLFYSVYVPVVTYACSPLIDGDCDLLDNLLSKILCASLLFVGIFVCYLGHRFFKSEMFIFGMLSGVIVTYILISLMAELEQTPLMGASFLSGILFGFIWLTFWWFYGIPVFSVLLTTLNFGFFASCVLFNLMPGGIILLKEDLNFWTIFILILLITSITLASATYPANILCCAVLGAYAVVFPIDYSLGSNLKYIVINTVRRATVDKFNLAVLSPPFEVYDALLTLLWVMLATTGFLFQHYHNRGKPPFPPPPRNVRERPEGYGATGTPYLQVTPASNSSTPQVYSTNERTPLLA